MTPDRWAEIAELFDGAREQSVSDREAFLTAATQDSAVRDEVLRMLAVYDSDPEFLEQPFPALGGADAFAARLRGRRIGAYRLVRELGHGGMAVVYEAERDDQEFDRTAAIKILPTWHTDPFAERFKFEGRVLASLDHRGIARLIDTGTTRDGISYIIMERVVGEPITDWCRRRALDTRAHVAMVERVADAVAYAHRSLVVHRDLKPSNILVTPEGQPKLLDFGIAAMLARDGATAGRTKTGHHSFTPQFASPEQIRGERVTTAADIYSLGVLLYNVLSDRPPYDVDNVSPLEAMRAICEVDPPPPSTVANPQVRSVIRGDLDAIVGKALRKVPSERYASVADFAADLHAWRTGHPVAARPAAWTYRMRRFVSRHKAGVATAVALIIALVGGASATAWQAHIARLERDKARNRFVQVREFSRSLLFDVHDALRQLPGATEPRRLLLERAVQFLDGLASDAGEDDALILELVEGYRRLGHVQGAENSENVGDTAGALRSFDRATQLAETALAADPDDVNRIIIAARATADLMSALHRRGETERAENAAAKHLQLVERLATFPADSRTTARVARGYSDAGMFKSTMGDLEMARRHYTRAVELFEGAAPDLRAEGEYASELATVLKRLGAVLMVSGDLAGSESRYTRALALDREALALRPGDGRTQYAITFTMSDLALVLFRQGKLDAAVDWWTQALEIRREAMARDHNDVRAMGGVATIYGRLGRVATERHDFALAAHHYGAELALREQLLMKQGALPGLVSDRAWARLRLAESRLQQADAAATDARRAQWRGEAQRLVRSTGRSDGRIAVPAGSEPGFLRLHAALTRRLAQ